jgi:hypothetical protein
MVAGIAVDITGVASQPPIPALPNAEGHARPAHGATPSVDSIGTLLANLATPSIQNLLAASHLGSERPAPELSDALIRAAGGAIAAHDIPRALHAVSEWVRLNPESADSVLREPALQPVQNEVRALLARIGHEARIGAETVLNNAAQLTDSGRVQVNLIPGGLDPPDVLALANRFYETGQLANYLRAEALGRVVIGAYEDAPVRQSGQFTAWLKSMWRRAPMLILLAAWLLVGLIGGLSARGVRRSGSTPGGLAFELWGIGFLVLVVVQFFATVYNRNSKNLK